MTARLRYVALIAARTRTPLVPLAITLFCVIGVFAYPHNEVGGTWGPTALLCCALAAWLVGAMLAGEPEAQADMVTVALGGRRARAGLDLVLAALVAVGLTVVFIGFPLLMNLLGRHDTFDRAVLAGDVAVAAVSHLCCAALGGTIGILFGPPRVTRRATSAAAVTATLIALVALSRPLGALGGPAAVAETVTEAAPGAVAGAEIAAWLSCLALAIVTMAVSHRWTRARG